jgi:site-specific DNA-methyltransferase (adenine-specific)
MDTVKIADIAIPKRHRDIKPHVLKRIFENMQRKGYNPSFPITIDSDNTLTDGRHRITAAKMCGIEEVPYVLKPDGVLPLSHSVRCNSDQTLGSEDDVFDLAMYCWGYAQDGWLREQIAEALGIDKGQVSHYKKIKDNLHPKAFELAKGVTRNGDLSPDDTQSLVIQDVTIVTWLESHFRSLLKHLSWEENDRATMRAQLQAISDILDRFVNPPRGKNGKEQKVTADWIEGIAKRYAWRAALKKYAGNNLKQWVKLRARIGLFQNIDNGVFGDEETEASWERFKNAVEALNGKIPLLIVGRAEAMTEIESDSIDIIITSPPYNLKQEHWPRGGNGREPRESGIGYDQHGDDMPEDKYQEWQIACLQEMYRVAKEGASLFYNHKVRQRDGQIIHPLDWLRNEDNPWIIRQEIVWDRTSTHNHCPVLFWPHDERIYWMTKGKPILPDNRLKYDEQLDTECDKRLSTVWRFHGPRARTSHPAPFPTELPRRCLKAIGRDGITVLDAFAGSCTTLKVAMEEFGYDAIGVDVSEEYLNRAKEENGWKNGNEPQKVLKEEISSN